MNIEHEKLVLSLVEMAYEQPETAQVFFSFLSSEELETLPELRDLIQIVTSYNSADSSESTDKEYRKKVELEAKKLKVRGLEHSRV